MTQSTDPTTAAAIAGLATRMRTQLGLPEHDANRAAALAVAVSLETTLASGMKPAAFIRAYAEANPPNDGPEGQVVVRFYEYGENTVHYDDADWNEAREDDEVDHLIDHDSSDMETNTLLVTSVDAGVIEPYSPWKDDA
jgi:hypothetical protein